MMMGGKTLRRTIEMEKKWKCEICGCTEEHACKEGGCSWVAQNLCSACVPVLYDMALKKWGPLAQLNQLNEECAELIVAGSHLMRESTTQHYRDVVEEVIDVEIMLGQLKLLLNVAESDWKIARSEKLARLAQRLGLGKANQ